LASSEKKITDLEKESKKLLLDEKKKKQVKKGLERTKKIISEFKKFLAS
jgi:hypothetical protein